ncbi:U2 small nuclear ribonucleoprotein auxiliary factor 35 kDa subunit-related protein 2 [Protopterus annectens]|uniref:U2 small nuclear ribonucleoprotein auxiliary factor 35 kDa subunit-related protein 2 n=1 Tax=Protopterus annectens TaxID=7888 RepID=UPI001CFBED0A|nr:U2 small nuclear ribonucleoprotein auxiliary factor 35 kDa subunit-related protein 2 [Protopterus annectens]
MAAPLLQQLPEKLSHKQRRAFIKKERRRKKRQLIAKLREAEELKSEEQSDFLQEEEVAVNETEEAQLEAERQRLHQEWLEREEKAKEEFILKKEREECARRRQEEEEKRIREEWEEQQRKEQAVEDQKQQEKREREEAVQKMLDQAENQLGNGGVWHNPEAPVDYGTEKDKANCPFYLKTGACRFGERCSRRHSYPSISQTLLIRNMFVTFGMEQCKRDDYDTDASLEYSDEETYQQFIEFYEDVLPEFKSAGKVVQFKVSCNFEPHLRGNVYVQYQTEEQCQAAFSLFNGRWYAGKQLHCEFSPVTRWKTAICGLFERQKCPRGKHCNFLHVFKNLTNEFWEADRDIRASPERSVRQLSVRSSERRERLHHHDFYNWSRRRRSPISYGSYRRNGESERKRRSGRSRERRRYHRSRSPEKRRSRSRGRSRERAKSRTKSRSRSRGRKRSRSRGRSRDNSPVRSSRRRRAKSSSSKSRSRSFSKGRRSHSRGRNRERSSSCDARKSKSCSRERTESSSSEYSRSLSPSPDNQNAKKKFSHEKERSHLDNASNDCNDKKPNTNSLGNSAQDISQEKIVNENSIQDISHKKEEKGEGE